MVAGCKYHFKIRDEKYAFSSNNDKANIEAIIMMEYNFKFLFLISLLFRSTCYDKFFKILVLNLFDNFQIDNKKSDFFILSWSTRSKWGKILLFLSAQICSTHCMSKKEIGDFMEVSWNKRISRRHEIGSWR